MRISWSAKSNTQPGLILRRFPRNLPNVAIPHTEGEFVNTRMIVPIELVHPVKFHNMIEPDKELDVKFLFMILNNDPEGQANILAQIMDFLNSTPVEQLKQLFSSKSTSEIYEFLKEVKNV